MTRTTMLRGAAIWLAVSSGAALAADPTPEELADILTGDALGEAADNTQCQLFTPDEIAGFVGEPVAAGINAGMGMACQWLAEDGEGDVMVSVVPSEYSDRPSLAPSFQDLPSLGLEGYVAEDLGGWVAGAVSGESFVKVAVAGKGASAEAAIELLRESLARRGR